MALTDHNNKAESRVYLQENTAFFFGGNTFRAAISALETALRNNAGLFSLTGTPGTGISTVITHFIEQASSSLYCFYPLHTPKRSCPNVCQWLLTAFTPDAGSEKTHDEYKQKLLLALEQHKYSNTYPVVVIDDAHNISTEFLNKLYLLAEQFSALKLRITIILSGYHIPGRSFQPQGSSQPSATFYSEHRLTALSEAETELYIRHKLESMPDHLGLLNYLDYRSIFKKSAGIPLLINQFLRELPLEARSNRIDKLSSADPPESSIHVGASPVFAETGAPVKTGHKSSGIQSKPTDSLRSMTFLPKPANRSSAADHSSSLNSTTLTFLPKTNAGLLEAPVTKRHGLFPEISSQTLTVLSRRFARLLPAPQKGLAATKDFLSSSSDLVTLTFLPKVRDRLSLLSTATKSITLPKMNTRPSVFGASRWIETLEHFPRQTNQIARIQEKLPTRAEWQAYYLPKAKAGISALSATAKSIHLPRLNTRPTVFPASRWIEALDQYPKRTNRIARIQKKLSSGSRLQAYHLAEVVVRLSSLVETTRSISLSRLNIDPSAFITSKRNKSLGQDQKHADQSPGTQITPPGHSGGKSGYLPKARARTYGLSSSAKSVTLPKSSTGSAFLPAGRWMVALGRLQKHSDRIAAQKEKLLAQTELNAYSLSKTKARLSGLPDSVKSISFPAIQSSAFGIKEHWLTALASLSQYQSSLVSIRKKLPDVKTLVSQFPKPEPDTDTRTDSLLPETRLPENSVKALEGTLHESELAENLQQRNGRILDLVSLSLTVILLILVWAGRDQLGI